MFCFYLSFHLLVFYAFLTGIDETEIPIEFRHFLSGILSCEGLLVSIPEVELFEIYFDTRPITSFSSSFTFETCVGFTV